MSTALAAAKTKSTILVIEDYSDTRELLSGLLRYKGFDVIEAEDGLEGLLKASAAYPDLIILDLALPEMDGIEAARRIHEQAKLSHTPIFVISAFVTPEVEDDARAAGCMEIFPKPFDVDELLRRINARLN
ncbi:MAG TPA: response regulator [Pyrinomonadaceae bacterium]|nr:response regulator [Pyrinomonadaceae bacterium]